MYVSDHFYVSCVGYTDFNSATLCNWQILCFNFIVTVFCVFLNTRSCIVLASFFVVYNYKLLFCRYPFTKSFFLFLFRYCFFSKRRFLSLCCSLTSLSFKSLHVCYFLVFFTSCWQYSRANLSPWKLSVNDSNINSISYKVQ